MIQRIIGVFKLDSATFESIEHDKTATSQAVIVVLIVAVLSAVGGGLGGIIGGGGFGNSFMGSLVWMLIGWALWSVASWFVGTKLFKGTATIDEMLRVIGFAYAPLILSIIPCIGFVIGIIWALIAGFIAIRQGLDLDNTKAFITALIGLVLVIVGNLVISALFSGIGLPF